MKSFLNFLNTKDVNYSIVITKNVIKQTFLNITKNKFLGIVEKFCYENNLRENFAKLFKSLLFLNKSTAKNFENGGYWCFVYNDKLCEMMHLKETRIREMLRELKRLGIIETKMEYDQKTRRLQRRIYVKYLFIDDLENIKVVPEIMHKEETHLCEDGCTEKIEDENFFEQESASAPAEKRLGTSAGAPPNEPKQNYENIDVEGSRKGSTIKINNINKYIAINKSIATTSSKEIAKHKSIDTEEKSAQNKTEEKVVVENDFVFSKPVKGEKSVFVENCNYTKYLFGLNAGLSKTTSTKIKQLEDEFLELGKLYYEGRKFTGPLRPLMARDYCKARERYIRLCLAGVTNKEATKLEIEKYLRWLAYDKTRTKQKIWSFMISPFRQWDDSREKAATLTEPSTGFDYSNEEFLKSIDPFENGVEEDMKKKSLPKKQLEEEFDKAWELYPRKKGKEKARKYFERDRNDGIDFEKILHGVKCYAAEVEKEKIEEEFIKHGSTWFNGKYWADYEGLAEPKSKSQIEKEKAKKREAERNREDASVIAARLRLDQEHTYQSALNWKKEHGDWETSYLEVMPEWVREKEGITKEQLRDWIEHPRNPF